MATALAPTTTTTSTLPERPIHGQQINGYKDFNPIGSKSWSKATEVEGTGKHAPAAHPEYLPVWEETKYPPLQPFEHIEHGKGADPTFKDLLKEGSKLVDLTANIGAEVTGVQLHELSDAGKDQLALLVAQKKVVAFRDQEWANLPIKELLDFGGYFGRHHIHPTSGAPKGYPEVHIVHRAAEDTSAADLFTNRTTSVAWHSGTPHASYKQIANHSPNSPDVTYEQQPPGTTFLYALDIPESGGDTLFVNQAAAYRRLSPAFRERLQGLKAVHTGVDQANGAKSRGGIVRREPVTSIHPVVRTHPATGEKALFVNPQFTRYIVGFKKEESDYLLKFLYDHIAYSADLQARVKWAPKTVVLWDNRVTAHSALLDWEDGQRRHIARITPQAERPQESFE